MIPGQQRVPILQRVIQEKEQDTMELAKAKQGNVVHAQVLAHERHDQEDANRDQHGTLVERSHQE